MYIQQSELQLGGGLRSNHKNQNILILAGPLAALSCDLLLESGVINTEHDHQDLHIQCSHFKHLLYLHIKIYSCLSIEIIKLSKHRYRLDDALCANTDF